VSPKGEPLLLGLPFSKFTALCPLLRRFAHRVALKVVFHQFHDGRLIARATPAIAHDAADQYLAVVVDFGERELAVGAKSRQAGVTTLTGSVTRREFAVLDIKPPQLV